MRTEVEELVPRALDRIDRRGGAQRRGDVGEVFYVVDLDVDHHVEEVHRAVDDAQVGDVALVAGDHRRQLGQAARLVGDRDFQAPGVDAGLAFAHRIPADIDPALGRFREAFQRAAVDGVDGHALAGGYYADDAVARQRVAAARKVD